MRSIHRLILGKNAKYKPASVFNFWMAITLLVFIQLIAQSPKRVFGQVSRQIDASSDNAMDSHLAHFATMSTGEWRVTAASGTSMYHTWKWGPGNHSIRRFTDGKGADGKSWREVVVYYWHPERKQICLLGFSPYANGLSDGTIKFNGKTAEVFADLYQTGTLRKMRLNWTFNGPDKYQEKLSEAVGDNDFQTLVEFEHVRNKKAFERQPAIEDGAELDSKFPEHLQPLAPFVGTVWRSTGRWMGNAFDIQTTFELIPLVNVLYLRVTTPGENGDSTQLLDGYIYRHTGSNVVRCLALSKDGGLYEGDVSAKENSAIQIDLKGFNEKGTQRHLVRFDLHEDGTIRQRVWNQIEAENELVLDCQHKQ